MLMSTLWPRMIWSLLCLAAIGVPKGSAQNDSVLIIWWNVENAFDTLDDPRTQDDAFTPKGSKQWTSLRYYRKLQRISKGLRSAAGTHPPDMIGLCEIENATVLDDLMRRLPWEWNLWSCHQESPDARGIDVAVLYAHDRWRLDSVDFLHATSLSGSRDIVFTAFQHRISGRPWVGMWVHLPSQRNPKTSQRILALDPVWAYDSLDFLIGDFNSHPHGVLGSTLESHGWEWIPGDIPWGTYAYGRRWSYLDSGWMRQGSPWKGLTRAVPFGMMEGSHHIPSIRPTFYAGRYYGGASDHLPIVCVMWLSEPLPYIYLSN